MSTNKEGWIWSDMLGEWLTISPAAKRTKKMRELKAKNKELKDQKESLTTERQRLDARLDELNKQKGDLSVTRQELQSANKELQDQLNAPIAGYATTCAWARQGESDGRYRTSVDSELDNLLAECGH